MLVVPNCKNWGDMGHWMPLTYSLSRNYVTLYYAFCEICWVIGQNV